MTVQGGCLDILIEGDHSKLRRVWGEVFPHLPGPKTDEEAEIVLHHSRTQTARVPFKLRAWSHKWLVERELPSALPDELKPKAERLYPVVAEAVFVGVGLNDMRGAMRPALDEIRDAMANAAGEAMADGHRDTAFIRGRMQEARTAAQTKLFGRTGAN
jgi:hypothetical protein